jgi:hypothetical protein
VQRLFVLGSYVLLDLSGLFEGIVGFRMLEADEFETDGLYIERFSII